MEKQYKYTAFISYRHTEPDKTIATELQKMLENYKAPKSVSKNFKRWCIFRDETELPTSSNLSGDIKTALENSEFLIVICSPKTQQSKWCMEEITYFKELHNGNNSKIITLIVDGEPSEAFPAELCHELIPVSDENGVVTYQSREIEPLAASVVAPSTKASLKKLKTEFLRIAAPLLGCGYDALYNRNQKRKMRQLSTIVALIIVFLLAFGLYTSAMLFKINSQKSALQLANDKLQMKTAQLNVSNNALQKSNTDLTQKTKEAQDNLKIANEQRALAEANLKEANRQKQIAQENEAKTIEQTRRALLANANHLNVLSEIHWNNGDTIDAIQTVLAALPSENEAMPVLDESERILANQIDAFSRNTFVPVSKLSHSSPVEYINYVGNGATIVTRDAGGVYLWDSLTGAMKKKYTGADFDNATTVQVAVEHNGAIKTSSIASAIGAGFYATDTYIDKYIKTNASEERSGKDDLFVYSDRRVYKINGKTGDIMWQIDAPADALFPQIKIAPDAIVVYNFQSMETYSKETGMLLNRYTCPSYISSYTDFVSLVGDKFYILDMSTLSYYDVTNNEIGNQHILQDIHTLNTYVTQIDNDIITLSEDGIITNYTTAINVYDANTAQLRWSTTTDTQLSSPFVGKLTMDKTNLFCDFIFVAAGTSVTLHNAEDGTLLHTYRLDGNIVNTYYSEDGIIYVTTDAGSELAINLKFVNSSHFENPYYIGIFRVRHFVETPAKLASFGNNYAIAKNNASSVTLYTDCSNPDYTELHRVPENNTIDMAQITPSGTYVASSSSDAIRVQNIRTNEITILDVENSAQFGFLNDQYLAVLQRSKSLHIYNLADMTMVYSENTIASNMSIAAEKVIMPIDSKTIRIVTPDGRTTQWVLPRVADTISSANGIFRTYSISDTGFIAAVTDYSNNKYALEVYNTRTEKVVLLDVPAGVLTSKTVMNIPLIWMPDNTLVVCSDAHKLYRFDPLTGNCLGQAQYDDIQTFTTFAIGSNSSIGILGKDSKIYKVNILTGETEAVVESADLDISSVLASSVKSIVVPDKNFLILTLGTYRYACLMNTQTFSIRYEMTNFLDYCPATNEILLSDYFIVGTYPIYSTDALIQKAQHLHPIN